jgi:hypothetical protein
MRVVTSQLSHPDINIKMCFISFRGYFNESPNISFHSFHPIHRLTSFLHIEWCFSFSLPVFVVLIN